MGMTLLEALGLVEVGATDFAEVKNGQTATQTIDGYTITVEELPNGPVAPYQTINGSVLSILEIGFMDYAAFSAGAPAYLAEKLGNTWYGESFQKTPPAATTQTA